MSLFAAYHSGEPMTYAGLCDQLAGNLCRCTGYRPIIAAALQTSLASLPTVSPRRSKSALRRSTPSPIIRTCSLAARPLSSRRPRVSMRLRAVCAFPDATLVGGATDVGLWVTKQLRDLKRVIWLGRVAGLDSVGESAEDGALSVGAGVTLADAIPLYAIYADLGELLRRFGSKQVRVSGTVGGNIANGSPSAILRALIALGGRVVLRKGDKTRALPLEDFFIAYGKSRAGEFPAVEAPRLEAHQRYRAFKVSKRFDEDISAVMLAVRVDLDGRTLLARARCSRGMAAMPKRAEKPSGRLQAPASTCPRPGANQRGLHPTHRHARDRCLP